MGFFHTARLIRGTKVETALKMKPALTAVLALAVTVLIMISPRVNMRTGNYGYLLPFWINALGATAVLWNTCRYADAFLEKRAPAIGLWLKGIGRDSIVYLCLNQIVILAVKKALNLVGISGFWIGIPVLMLTMAVLYGFEKFICQTKLAVMIGRSPRGANG